MYCFTTHRTAVRVQRYGQMDIKCTVSLHTHTAVRVQRYGQMDIKCTVSLHTHTAVCKLGYTIIVQIKEE